jgi:hypothetical protein
LDHDIDSAPGLRQGRLAIVVVFTKETTEQVPFAGGLSSPLCPGDGGRQRNGNTGSKPTGALGTDAE